MEIKLNVYKNKHEIEKTYVADTFRLWFGTIEDFAQAINLDGMKTGSDEEIIGLALKAISGSMETIKDLLKDVFDGLTDDELKKTDVSEIVSVIVEIVKYTFTTLGKGVSRKN
ncbi:MAG: hypothetical protein MJ000_11725 [Bacteroidales bacterium]|nr:hypothetical protein [Bacteroidales bacterium]